MKYFFLSLLLIMCSCTENSTNDNIEEEEEVIDAPRPIVPGYLILKKEEVRYLFTRNLSVPPPYSTIEKVTYVHNYEYNSDYTIKEYHQTSTFKHYDYQNGTIASNPNSTSVDTNSYFFNYENNKISHIILKHTQVSGASKSNYRIDFTYDNNKLTRFNRYETWPFLGKFQTDYILSWSKDLITFIPGENVYRSQKNIELKDNGNFKKREGSIIIYDNKNNPDDLVFPKYLLGYKEYGSGNRPLTLAGYYQEPLSPDECDCEYIYNDYDFPTKYTQHYSDDRPDLEITFTYNQ